MRKIKTIFSGSVIMLGSFGILAPSPAIAGPCEMAHAAAIVNCNGNQQCMSWADFYYQDCLSKENVPQD